MKKTYSVIFVIFMLIMAVGCENDNEDIIVDSKSIIENADIMENISFNDDYLENCSIWNGDDVSKEIKIDERLALEIGNAVLDSHFGHRFEGREVQLVLGHSRYEDYYMVSKYTTDKSEEHYEFCVAISKSNGQILKIFPM